MTHPFSVVIEREDDGGFSACVPDLPGCASMGDSRAEALRKIREAVTCHVEGMRKPGRRLPARRAIIEVVRVKAA